MKLFGAIVDYDYPDYYKEVIGISESVEGCKKLIEKYKYNTTKYCRPDEIYENTDDTLTIRHGSYSFEIKEVELDTLFEDGLF